MLHATNVALYFHLTGKQTAPCYHHIVSHSIMDMISPGTIICFMGFKGHYLGGGNAWHLYPGGCFLYMGV